MHKTLSQPWREHVVPEQALELAGKKVGGEKLCVEMMGQTSGTWAHLSHCGVVLLNAVCFTFFLLPHWLKPGRYF